MNKLLSIVGALTLVFAGSVVANDEGKEKASAEMIAELTQMCLDWSKDDGVEAASLKKYVLDCVNGELTANGYEAVTDVDIK